MLGRSCSKARSRDYGDRGLHVTAVRREERLGLPLVAIVGAPNVGKSRLFNRLTGRRSIVHDRPGVTRDRLEGICEWLGRRFRVMDTGGLVPGSADELTAGVERQVLKGIAEAALLLFVVDGRTGLTALDQSLALLLRRRPGSLLLVVNKVDAAGQEGAISDFFSLRIADPIPVSAEEGRGISALLDSILVRLPESTQAVPARAAEDCRIRLALVGKPNVGKSTLFNRLAGDERAVVSARPGTTRDPVDAEFDSGRYRYRIVDTAGFRRKARSAGEEVESQSIERALSVLQRADLAVALLDALEPLTHQDQAVVGACQKVRRPTVVAVNKVDLLPGGRRAREHLMKEIRSRLRFAGGLPILTVSALQGEGMVEFLRTLDNMVEESFRRIATADLNRALEEAVQGRAPAGRGRIPRLYYITQTGVSPPSFVVFTNGASLDSTYRRYLTRHLRQTLGFALAPISLRFRKRTGKG